MATKALGRYVGTLPPGTYEYFAARPGFEDLSAGGDGSVAVEANGSWTAVADNAWVQITTPAARSGETLYQVTQQP